MYCDVSLVMDSKFGHHANLTTLYKFIKMTAYT